MRAQEATGTEPTPETVRLGRKWERRERRLRRTAGWVTVRLRGAVSGRQLTKLAEQIGIRRVWRCGQETELTLRAADLNRVRHLLRGAGVRMRIVKKSPLTHLRPAARRHAGLIAAALTALLLLGGLMQTVLTVTVDGAKDAQQKEEMVRLLAARGIRPGAYFPGVDRDGAAAEVLRSFSGLTYAALRRRGLGMELYVVQATPPPEIYDPMQRTDVVAEAGGLVTRVVTLSGEALVRPGDTVVAGQVLIRGTESAPHARGAVSARVWAVGRGGAERERTQRVPTGRSERRTVLRIGKGGMLWPQGREWTENFSEFDERSERTLLLDGLFFPVEIVRETREEVRVEKAARRLTEAKDEAGARALTNALTKLPNGARVVDKRIEYSMIKDGKLCAAVTIEGAMQIGREVPRGSDPEAGSESKN